MSGMPTTSKAVDLLIDTAKAAPQPRIHGPFMEGFRLLALNLQRILTPESTRSILVMSARPREGRSTTVRGLARALAEMGTPVVVIDADPEGRGLEGMAMERVESLWRAGQDGKRPSLQVITPWTGERTEGDLLESVHDAIDEAVTSGATVIIDAPAATTSSVGFYLATSVTGVLYLARSRVVRDPRVHVEVRSQLDLLGARVLGVVINEG